MEFSHAVRLEQVRLALSEVLGPSFRIEALSESTLTVSRNLLIRATVRIERAGDGTRIWVRPTGLLLVLVANALYTVPKVRHALDMALSDGRLVDG